VSASELEQPSVGVVPLGTIHRCGGSVGPTAIAESRAFASGRAESVDGADIVKALEELVAAGLGACHPIG